MNNSKLEKRIEEREKQIQELQAKLEKDKSILSAENKKKRDNYLIAFGLLVEQILKNEKYKELGEKLKTISSEVLSVRDKKRVSVGFEILMPEQKTVKQEETEQQTAGQEAEIIRLCVKYEERDKVKALGAKWNNKEKFWYVEKGIDLEPFQQWLSN